MTNIVLPLSTSPASVLALLAELPGHWVLARTAREFILMPRAAAPEPALPPDAVHGLHTPPPGGRRVVKRLPDDPAACREMIAGFADRGLSFYPGRYGFVVIVGPESAMGDLVSDE